MSVPTTNNSVEAPANRGASDSIALLDFLATRDVPCPMCKYNLRSLTVDRCPECGNMLRLNVGLVKVRMGAWICAMVAILPDATIGLLVGLVIFHDGFPPLSSLKQPHLWFFFLLIYVLFAIPASIALLLFRRTYLRAPDALQLGLAFCAIAMDVAGVMTIIVMMN